MAVLIRGVCAGVRLYTLLYAERSAEVRLWDLAHFPTSPLPHFPTSVLKGEVGKWGSGPKLSLRDSEMSQGGREVGKWGSGPKLFSADFIFRINLDCYTLTFNILKTTFINN